MAVNVHFERDLVLRDLRERLHRISFLWPRYPEALGVIVSPRKEGSTSGLRPSQKAVRGKQLSSVLFSACP